MAELSWRQPWVHLVNTGERRMVTRDNLLNSDEIRCTDFRRCVNRTAKGKTRALRPRGRAYSPRRQIWEATIPEEFVDYVAVVGTPL